MMPKNETSETEEEGEKEREREREREEKKRYGGSCGAEKHALY